MIWEPLCMNKIGLGGPIQLEGALALSWLLFHSQVTQDTLSAGWPGWLARNTHLDGQPLHNFYYLENNSMFKYVCVLYYIFNI